MLEQQFISPESDRDKKTRRWIIANFVVLCLTLVFSILAMVFALGAKNKNTDLDILPTKYGVPDAYVLPPTNQSNIGTCWSFSMIYLLESQYRAQGIKAGFLHPDEYVTFSEQALFTWLHDECVKHQDVKACHYGGLLQGRSNDNQVESLYYFLKAFPDLGHSIVPESVCPYRSKPDEGSEEFKNWSYFWCPGLDEVIKKNPIHWRIKEVKSAYNLNDIKRLLIKSNRALGIGTPLPNMVYWVPCTEDFVSQTDACKEQRHVCPKPNPDTKYCAPFDVDGRQRDGVFMTNFEPENVKEMGGHAMNIVGYNDDWVLRNKFMTSTSMAPVTGGFILHNSWRAEGHSFEYLMGNQSEENENVICPNHRVPLNWVPATLECTEQNVNGDYSLCAKDGYVHVIRGKGRTSKPDILHCKNAKLCDLNSKYVIARRGTTADVIELPGGLNEITIVKFEGKPGSYNNFTTIKTRNIPYWALSNMFEPDEVVENDPYQCGYWVLPYTTYDLMRRINYDLLDNFRVSDFEIEFEPRSFANSSYSKNYDLTHLRQSTHKFEKTKFDGPLPFDYVY